MHGHLMQHYYVPNKIKPLTIIICSISPEHISALFGKLALEISIPADIYVITSEKYNAQPVIYFKMVVVDAFEVTVKYIIRKVILIIITAGRAIGIRSKCIGAVYYAGFLNSNCI